MDDISKILDQMEPGEALSKLGPWLNKLFVNLDEETKVDFVMGLVNEPGQDKIASMVNL